MLIAALCAPRRRRVVIGLCAAYWAAAFLATHIPPEYLPRLGASDVVLHAGGYFVLAGLFILTLAAQRVPRWLRAAMTVTVMLVYAALDEITQVQVGRTVSLGDWLADLDGVAAAVLIWELGSLAWQRARAAPTGPDVV